MKLKYVEENEEIEKITLLNNNIDKDIDSWRSKYLFFFFWDFLFSLSNQ